MSSQAKTSPDLDSASTTDLSSGEMNAEVLEDLESSTEQNTASGSEWEVKYSQMHDQYTRLAADFENFRKRTRDEQAASLKYGAQSTIQALLPVLDNIERATASLTDKSDPQVLFKSFQLIQKNLMDGLSDIGLEKINAVGRPFDPQLHEAVSRMASAEIAENSVLYESQGGYKLHDKVIRPSQVVVSTGSADGENPFK